ncbi:hypothetical protein GT037_008752 [Alternaria burnsii]|uniref:Uncharacterized protein n=1 Tax=Alternaria burnsii TaxID=1187904 RepID=A0A8H7EDB2_9PLEO|nr:uncharacterized protein GT037_008752 [Alternaria burnsii]KAF7673429.1 hypothetical protein GT037_008752 [Alternaria burnsii]CAI9637773.1 unnamed protein product [Alternaria burnsii]
MSAVYPKPEAESPAAKDVEEKLQKAEADIRIGNHVSGFWLAQEAIALAESCIEWDAGDVVSTQQLVVVMLRRYNLFKEAEQIEAEIELNLEDLSDEETRKTIQDEINVHKRQTPNGLEALDQSIRSGHSQRHSLPQPSLNTGEPSHTPSTKKTITGVEHGLVSQTCPHQPVRSMDNTAEFSLEDHSNKKLHALNPNGRSGTR